VINEGEELDAIVEATATARRTLDARANQFAFAGLAAIWIFRATGQPLALPSDLFLAGALFITTLGVDFLDLVIQYAAQADPLRLQRWLHVPSLPWYVRPILSRRNIGDTGTFTIPLSRILFVVKLVSLAAGFALLLRYLFAHAARVP
jgi:hypothetical protein